MAGIDKFQFRDLDTHQSSEVRRDMIQNKGTFEAVVLSDFDADNTPPVAKEEPAPPPQDLLPPPLSMTQEELNKKLDQARREGFAEGKTEGQNETRDAINMEEKATQIALQTVCQSIESRMQEIASGVVARQHHSYDATANLALAIAKTLGDENPAHTIDAIHSMVKDCMDILLTQPQATLTVHTTIAPHLMEVLQQLPHYSQISSILTLHPTDNVDLTTAILHWKDGEAFYDESTNLEAIKSIIYQHLNTSTAQNEAPDNAHITPSSSHTDTELTEKPVTNTENT